MHLDDDHHLHGSMNSRLTNLIVQTLDFLFLFEISFWSTSKLQLNYAHSSSHHSLSNCLTVVASPQGFCLEVLPTWLCQIRLSEFE